MFDINCIVIQINNFGQVDITYAGHMLDLSYLQQSQTNYSY